MPATPGLACHPRSSAATRAPLPFRTYVPTSVHRHRCCHGQACACAFFFADWSAPTAVISRDTDFRCSGGLVHFSCSCHEQRSAVPTIFQSLLLSCACACLPQPDVLLTRCALAQRRRFLPPQPACPPFPYQFIPADRKPELFMVFVLTADLSRRSYRAVWVPSPPSCEY